MAVQYMVPYLRSMCSILGRTSITSLISLECPKHQKLVAENSLGDSLDRIWDAQTTKLPKRITVCAIIYITVNIMFRKEVLILE